MILDDIANLIALEHQKRPATELGRIFDRGRKTIYMLESGCTFHLDYGFIGGLSALGYELKLVKRATGEVYEPPEVERSPYERPKKKKYGLPL